MCIWLSERNPVILSRRNGIRVWKIFRVDRSNLSLRAYIMDTWHILGKPFCSTSDYMNHGIHSYKRQKWARHENRHCLKGHVVLECVAFGKVAFGKVHAGMYMVSGFTSTKLVILKTPANKRAIRNINRNFKF